MPLKDDYSYGWNPDLESQHDAEIAKVSTGFGVLNCAAPAAEAIPLNLEIDWFTQDDQGAWPFCHAHMRAGIEEVLYWLTTKGKVKQASRLYDAITDMRMDGNDSSPEGASIGGSLRAAIKDGWCEETILPYPPLYPQDGIGRHYSNKIPETATEDSKHRHIKSIVPGIRTYKDVDAALVSGRTAVGFGMNWLSGWGQIRGVGTVNSTPSGRNLGGHALFFFGWRTISGLRYPILHNSHNGWGIKRRAAIHPHVVDDILAHSQFGAFAVTNIEIDDPIPQPQPWDWLTSGNFQSGPVDPFGGT